MKISFILIMVFTIFISSCYEGERKLVKNNILIDTLESPNLSSQLCKDMTVGYQRKFNCYISNYYSIEDFIDLDTNNDNLIDTLAIFSPVSLSFDAKGFEECQDDNSNRILVEFINIGNGRSKIGKIYDKVISNELSRAWAGYERFEKRQKGFVLYSSRGQGCLFEYSIFITSDQNKLYADSIYFYSKCPNFSAKEFTYNLNGVLLDQYNRTIIDSIKIKEEL